jgi:hypothetical protein
MGFRDTVETGVGMYGKVETLKGSVSSFFTGLVLIGVSYIVYKSTRISTIKGKILDIQDCRMRSTPSANNTVKLENLCDIKYKYEINGKEYTGTDTGAKDAYTVGEYATVYYNESKPYDSSLTTYYEKYIALLFFFIGISSCISSIISGYFVSVSDEYAKISGAGYIASNTLDYAGITRASERQNYQSITPI